MASQVDVDPQETREWLEALDAVVAERRPGARAVPDRARDRARAAPAPRPRRRGRRRTSTRSRRRPSRLIPATRRSSTACARSCAGTRSRWWCRRTRRHRSSAATSRASRPRRRSTTSASTTSGTRRPTTHGGDLVYIQGHSAPGIYARAFLEGRLTEEQLRDFRQEVGGERALLLPAPVADAGLLAVPDRVDGPRPADGDLPGALHEVPARPRAGRDRGPQGLGVRGRRRDGRAGVARRDLARRPRAARQPDLRRQLQPAAARRAGARQRQDHPGARERSSAAPAGT